MRIQLSIIVGLGLLASQAFGEVPFEAWGGSVAGWSRVVDRCETQLRDASARGCSESVEREATISQIRSGSASLRALVVATTVHDTLLAGPMITTPPPWPKQGQWGNRYLRVTGLTCMSLGLWNLYLGMQEFPDHQLRETIGNASGIVGGVGGMFGMLRPRSKQPPWVDPVERASTTMREMLLRDTFAETERRLHDLVDELSALEAAPATSDSAAAILVRRYAGALDLAGSLYDIQVPHTMMTARQGSNYPHFTEPARARMARLADHLDKVGAEWRQWRWLIGRSQRSALEYLALAERH